MAGSISSAHAWELPPAWLTREPGSAEAAELARAAEREGWRAVGEATIKGALAGYERAPDRSARVYDWLLIGRWAETFGEKENSFIPRWIEAIDRARVGHPNMARTYEAADRGLGDRLRPDFIAWLLTHRTFAESFFELLSPCDYLPTVLSTLERLHRADPIAFETYAQLALAIALVYDVPPPPGWPHGQVGPRALPRRLPDPQAAFDFLVKSDRAGRLLQRIAYLNASELKFLVDLAAPFEELAWAQNSLRVSLAQLPTTYVSVVYRHDRVAANAFDWAGPAYTLPQILETGGICVDQAYFATQSAKARGVPTMIFRGAGLDGRHAWFGFLDGNRRWQLDAGRIAEQKLVTGLAHDPQTWGDLSDHAIQFLSDGFRLSPRFRQALVQGAFASRYLAAGDAPAAIRAARRAVNFESRHVDAWETLFAAFDAARSEPKAIEAALREASLAFQRYPDLNSRFSLRLTASLRARGETSAADHEDRMLARKHQGERNDLSFDQAMSELSRALGTQSLFEQLRVYRTVVDQFGRGEGIAFFDKVVRPFVTHLAQAGKSADAARALGYARTVLVPAPDSQLDREMVELAKLLRL